LEENKNYVEHSLEICSDEKQFKLDVVYLRMAKEWATNSKCKRSQVGCLVVKNKTIISDGYNGTPTGFPNECEDSDNNTLGYVLHAEANAIAKLAKGIESGEGAAMFLTHAPCLDCAKQIYTAGIKTVYYGQSYRSRDGIEFLKDCYVEVIQA